MALYLLANIAYMNVMTVPEIAATERVGAAVAGRAMGPAGATVLSAVVLLSVIGAINGCILTAARIPFAIRYSGGQEVSAGCGQLAAVASKHCEN